MDIRNAYLHAEVDEEIYMRQPEGFMDEDRPTHVCRLKKALYGMHQAGFNWHKLIDKVLRDAGLSRSEHDACVYSKFNGEKWMIICLYVDDLLIGGDQESQMSMIEHLKSKFSVSAEGSVKRYLGINVTTNDDTWKLDQYDDIMDFLKEHNMESSRVTDRPGDPRMDYNEVRNGTLVNQAIYRSAVGGLLWFAIATRPDILYAVNVVAQFQQAPTSIAWNAVKKIMRYLSHNPRLGIEINPTNLELTVYSDVNHGDVALGD